MGNLVLSRKEKEEIVVIAGGEMVRVAIAEIRGDKVRLAINAPRDIAVHRSEVWDEIQAKALAAKGGEAS